MLYKKRTNRKVAVKGLTTVQKKAVATIAKKVTYKVAETKSALNTGIAYSHFDDAVYAQNLNFFLAQGISSEQIVGEKFYMKNIHIKGSFSNINSSISGNGTLTWRLAIIRTKKALTSSTLQITGTDVFRNSTTQIASLGMIDLHKVDLIYDKIHTISQPNISNANQNVPFDINVQINKTHFLDLDNSGYLKDKNYYLVSSCHKADGVAQNTGFIRFQYSLNFKDM